MNDAARILGLDGEMSGNELARSHRLIQIGVAVDTAADGLPLPAPELFCAYIGWDAEDMVGDARAAQVHNIPIGTVLAAPRADVVDAQLYDWLVARGASPDARRTTVLTGFNVGAFDAPFLTDALPRTATLFSRRYADLNPLCMALGASAGALLGGAPSASAWKRRLTAAGLQFVAEVGRREGQHDAGTDALIALGAWREAERTLAQLDGEAAQLRRTQRAMRKTGR